MKIALDYDDTYTVDPDFWENFRKLAIEHGHSVFLVTKRGENNKGILSMGGWSVYHTNRVGKAKYCFENGIDVDVWIDDSPINIFQEG